MAKAKPATARRFPLHMHISALFTLLLLATGMVLGVFNYQQTSSIILSSSEKLFARISTEVQLDLDHTYTPIRQLLSLLALDPSTRKAQPRERQALLAPFAQALSDNPKLAALYLGYPNGDFFMLRPLRSAAFRQRFEAPENAAFQLWTIEHNDGAVQSSYQFFDQQLNLLRHIQRSGEDFDPRTRPWYQSALSDAEQITTAPYGFFSSKQVGTTLARNIGLNIVLAADLTLDDLSATLSKHQITPSTEVLLFDSDGDAIAYPGRPTLLVETGGSVQLLKAAELSVPLAALLQPNNNRQQQGHLRLNKRDWIISRTHINEGGPQGLELALLVPEDELLAEAYRIRWQGAIITLATLLLCLPVGWLASRSVVKPLNALVLEAEAIQRFDFNHPASGRSPLLEVDRLALSMNRMKETIASFLEIAASLSAEKRFDTLLQRVLDETVSIGKASGGLLYLIEPDSGQLIPQALIIDGVQQNLSEHSLSSYHSGDPSLPDWLKGPASGGASAVVALGFDQAGPLQSLLHSLDSPMIHLVSCGLHNRQGVTLGVLQLLHRDNTDEHDPTLLRPERIALIEAVSGVAALCIDSQRLLEQQKHLLEAFIQLLAGAIDAKSPYTGGHCQRVPELTLMLAHAAADSPEPAFASYQPTEEQWEELHIAAWLHDCGKITTPEYVVDKATKLETLYDRIHEIRTRFEVLKRDAWIDYWQARSEGADASQQALQRDQRLSALDEEFAFIARCNLGGEAMAEADLARIQHIAQRTWRRTLDDRLGVSWEEAQRQARSPAPSLPVDEPLLADRPEHLLERKASEQMPADNPWGFKLEVPTYKFNRGELYNLSIARGTLTAEDRFIINDHIVQTIRMLNHLPFPPHLKNVAEIAGGHHEKMNGTGYPKRLKREDMSLPARMMAIADIFEALTAVDRPYKKGKTLSESLNIMLGMCKGAHVDTQLFELFVRSGVYRQYAQRFLKPEQIDAVDESSLLAKLAAD
ncbi:MAG: HD domain-containing phosphohydrolase [Pseudomonas sp.]|uniref:HD domain-containing phosphohydrolase n=1 Tax=Pseudomonas sp. TaxID=306 RepID=UPI00273509D9|nr:HD domain-containing phosphohydrolase [Pseudomonas sp.]MDP3844815.1 HD domain-containing phosphohydrolase [Pseudomonas sp.]